MRISDWSSDVCASDLQLAESSRVRDRWEILGLGLPQHHLQLVRRVLVELVGGHGVGEDLAGILQGPMCRLDDTACLAPAQNLESSDERRVGKECVSTCRSRWST